MSTKKSKIWEKNLYKLLETVSSASESDIKKAYRKKALKCHPDKNPDNPKAAELFHELSEALEILTDPKAKEAYDRTLKGKELAKERTRVLDSKRRKLKEDLERREQLAKEATAAARSKTATYDASVSDEEMLQKEIDRLKKEGSRALREEQELIRQQILREQPELIRQQIRREQPEIKTEIPNSTNDTSTSSTSFADFEAMILGQLSAAAAAQKDQIQSTNSMA